jgi:hypothetical protein
MALVVDRSLPSFPQREILSHVNALASRAAHNA